MEENKKPTNKKKISKAPPSADVLAQQLKRRLMIALGIILFAAGALWIYSNTVEKPALPESEVETVEIQPMDTTSNAPDLTAKAEPKIESLPEKIDTPEPPKNLTVTPIAPQLGEPKPLPMPRLEANRPAPLTSTPATPIAPLPAPADKITPTTPTTPIKTVIEPKIETKNEVKPTPKPEVKPIPTPKVENKPNDVIVKPSPTPIAEAPRVPMVAPKPKALPEAGALGYQVQLGLFTNMDNARRLVEKLKAAGVNAKSETRVHIGPFNTRAEAEEAMKQMREHGITPLLTPAGAR